jgi:hypothetical protein
MSAGHSFTSFAAKIKVGRRTLYDWCRFYPDFLAAYETGYSTSLLFYEKQLLKGICGKEKINSTLLIFALKTRFHKEYGVTERIEISDDMNRPIDITKINDPDELTKLHRPPVDMRTAYEEIIKKATERLAYWDQRLELPKPQTPKLHEKVKQNL